MSNGKETTIEAKDICFDNSKASGAASSDPQQHPPPSRRHEEGLSENKDTMNTICFRIANALIWLVQEVDN
jgi:hypothetical protein